MDRPKQGFRLPITDWFRHELGYYFTEYLDAKRLRKEGLFNTKVVTKIKDNYCKGDKEGADRLWRILMFEMWYKRWMV